MSKHPEVSRSIDSGLHGTSDPSATETRLKEATRLLAKLHRCVDCEDPDECQVVKFLDETRSKEMAKKKNSVADLPRTVYVSRVQGTNGDSSFLSADENRDSLVDDEQDATYVGKYELVDWQKLAHTVKEVE